MTAPGYVRFCKKSMASAPAVFLKLSVTTVLTSECVHEDGFGSEHSCSGNAMQPSQFSLPPNGTPQSTGSMPYFPIIAVGDQ